MKLTISDKVGGTCIMNIYIYFCILLCIYVRSYVRMYVYIYVCMDGCTCTPRLRASSIWSSRFLIGGGKIYYEYICFCI